MAVDLYSGTVLAINPMSRLEGDLRYSLVVVISFSFGSVTINLKTLSSLIKVDLTFTKLDYPSMV